MNLPHINCSLTRIANLHPGTFNIEALPVRQWTNADYVLAEIIHPGTGALQVELVNGRMITPMKGDLLLGALGRRHATLEATGTWELVQEDGRMHLLTGAGILGLMTSKSMFVPPVIELRYKGHVMRSSQPANMRDFVVPVAPRKFKKPVVLLVGTSMSAGKTTTGRIVTRMLKKAGKKVVGAKITGAGRYRDTLMIQDAGADWVFDFVDVGLPSTVCPKEEFMPALKNLLSLIEHTPADVAVIEVGASPLEPYNGDIAIQAIRKNIKCTILCASDPYAVVGVMKSFKLRPTLVTGIATNTTAGIELIEKLSQVPAFNMLDFDSRPRLLTVLLKSLET